MQSMSPTAQRGHPGLFIAKFVWFGLKDHMDFATWTQGRLSHNVFADIMILLLKKSQVLTLI